MNARTNGEKGAYPFVLLSNNTVITDGHIM